MDEHHVVKTKHKEKVVDVVWYGYSQNFHYVSRTLDTIRELGLHLTVISNQAMTAAPEYDAIRLKNIRYNQATINQDIAACDVALLPETVMKDFRGKFKSNNKTIIAWAMGMPVAHTPEELKALLPQEARVSEAIRRRKEVEDKWDVQLSVMEYQELIRDIQK